MPVWWQIVLAGLALTISFAALAFPNILATFLLKNAEVSLIVALLLAALAPTLYRLGHTQKG